MKDIKLIMENWRGFLKEQETPPSHSPHTLDTEEGIKKLVDAYKKADPSIDESKISEMPDNEVPVVTGTFAQKKDSKGKLADVYKGNGDKYEAEVFNYFLEVPDLQPFRGDFAAPAGSDASRADLDFYLPYKEGRVGPIKVEMKLNDKAQLGGSSIGVELSRKNEEGVELTGDTENPKLNLELAQNSGFDAEAVKEVIYPMLVNKRELLKKVPGILQKALEEQYNAIFKGFSQQIVEEINKNQGYHSEEQIKQLKEQLNKKLEEISEKQKEVILKKINQANKIFPLTTSVLAWQKVRADKSLKDLNKNIEEQKITKFLVPHYEKKEIHYIQIGNVDNYKGGERNPISKPFLYGLYRIGEEDPYDLKSVGVPSLKDVMKEHNIGYRLELRPGAAGSKKAEWCKEKIGECVPTGTEYGPEAWKMRSVNYRVQGRFYRKITKESLDNPSNLQEIGEEIGEEIGDSATDETVEINNDVQSALEKLQDIGKRFLKQIEKPEGTEPNEDTAAEEEQNDQDNNQEQ